MPQNMRKPYPFGRRAMVVGTILLIAIVCFKNSQLLESTVDRARAIEKLSLLPAIVSGVLQVLFQTTRLWSVIRTEMNIRLSEVFKAFTLGQIVNLTIPARMGDVVKSTLIAKVAKKSVWHAAGSVFVADKLVDIGAVFFLLILAGSSNPIFSLAKMTPYNSSVIVVAIVSLMIILCSFVLNKSLNESLNERFRKLTKDFTIALRSLKQPKTFTFSLFVGVLSWLAECLTLHVVGSSFGYNLSLDVLIISLAILNLGILIPVSFANIGIFEGSLGGALYLFNIPLDDGIAISAVHHAIQIGTILTVGLVASLMKLSTTEKSLAIDKERVLKYYDSRSANYDKSVERGPLLPIRLAERTAILKLIKPSIQPKATVIDVGCGGGFYSLFAKDLGAHVTAIDLSSAMVEKIRDKVDHSYVADIETLESQEQFDLIVCSGVLDFVNNPERAFANLCKLVKPHGAMVIQAPRKGLASHIYRFEKRLLAGVDVNCFTREWFTTQGALNGFSVETVILPLPHNMVVRLIAKPVN